jgi:hypothetical protein
MAQRCYAEGKHPPAQSSLWIQPGRYTQAYMQKAHPYAGRVHLRWALEKHLEDHDPSLLVRFNLLLRGAAQEQIGSKGADTKREALCEVPISVVPEPRNHWSKPERGHVRLHKADLFTQPRHALRNERNTQPLCNQQDTHRKRRACIMQN